MGAYFVLCGLVAALLLPSVHAIVSARATFPETADLSVFVAMIVYTAGAMLVAPAYGKRVADTKRRLSDRPARIVTGLLIVAGLALLAVLVASVTIVTLYPPFEEAFWFGYGRWIAAGAVAAIPVVIALLHFDNRVIHIVLALLTYGIVVVFYLPSIVQPPWGLIDVWHSRYVLNELMAPQSGGYPLVNFTAQYTSLLGYVFKWLFRSAGSVDAAVWLLTLLAIATVVIALLPLLRAYPPGKGYLALLFTVPAIFIVKPHEDAAYSGSVSALFSALPVRLLFAALVAAVLTTPGVRDNKFRSAALLAFCASLALVNNVESGVVATIAAAMVLTLSGKTALRLYQPVLFCALVAVLVAAEATFVAVAYGQPKLSTLTAYVGGFGSGFGAIAMPTFGLWIFVFVVLSLCAIASTLHFRLAQHASSAQDADNVRRLAVIALFWSAFGLGMSPYYVNRSVVAGQLQFLLFPAFIAAAALLPIMRWHLGRARNISLVVAALPCALSVASTTQHPSLHLAVERLHPRKAALTATYQPSIASLAKKIEAIKARDPAASVGLLTDFGFIVVSALHVRSYLPVNSQDDFEVVSPSIWNDTCAMLRNDGNRFLVGDAVLNDDVRRGIATCGYVASEIGTEPGELTVLERR